MDGKLTAWIELIEATEICAGKRVNDALNSLGGDDENYDCEGVKWNESFTVPMVMEIFYWDVPMWNIVDRLDPIAELLLPDEYMIFEEKRAHATSLETSTRTILVTHDRVEFLEGCSFVHQLKQKVAVAKLELEIEEDERDEHDVE